MIDLDHKRRYNRQRMREVRSGTWTAHHPDGPTLTPTALEVAWCAGFFQGEGHIRRDGRMATVSQVELEPLVNLRAWFGGSLRPMPPRNNQTPYWRWVVCGDNLRAFLRAVAPWLTGAKAERARLAVGGENVA